MLDLKTMHSALQQLQEERGIDRVKLIEAIEMALAAAYKKDYGKKGQIVRAKLELESGTMEFAQVKIVVSPDMLKEPGDASDEPVARDDMPRGRGGRETEAEPLSGAALIGGGEKIRFNEEHHIMLEDAKKIRADIAVGDEMIFPLETRDDFGRIAAQTAKQVIIQKVREAEKDATLEEYAGRGPVARERQVDGSRDVGIPAGTDVGVGAGGVVHVNGREDDLVVVRVGDGPRGEIQRPDRDRKSVV